MSILECAAALDKYRINPGNVGVGEKHDDNFRSMIEVAVAHGKPVRIGVNWGSLDRALLTRLMDENARRPEPLEDREVVLEAMRESAICVGGAGRALRPAARPHHPLRQGERRARPGRGLSRTGALAATIRCISGSPKPGSARRASSRSTAALVDPAQRRDRRHDPREPHPRAGRRPRRRGARVPAGAPVARDPALHTAGHVVSRAAAAPPARSSRSSPPTSPRTSSSG